MSDTTNARARERAADVTRTVLRMPVWLLVVMALMLPRRRGMQLLDQGELRATEWVLRMMLELAPVEDKNPLRRMAAEWVAGWLHTQLDAVEKLMDTGGVFFTLPK